MKDNISKLYDDYRLGKTSRRDFIRKLTLFTGSAAAAMSMLPVLEDNNLNGSSSMKDDSDLITEFVKYPAETGEMKAFLARPKKGKKFPAVIVIHENRGLQPHIQDVTKRMAKKG